MGEMEKCVMAVWRRMSKNFENFLLAASNDVMPESEVVMVVARLVVQLYWGKTERYKAHTREIHSVGEEEHHHH